MTTQLNNHDARYLIDTSAWARLTTGTVDAQQILTQLTQRGMIVTCPPQVLEILFSTRNIHEHQEIRKNLEQFSLLVPDERTHVIAVTIQESLWRTGKIRAVGAFDTYIAAIALQNRTTVVHYDADYEHIANLTPGFRHQWVVPRGSVS